MTTPRVVLCSLWRNDTKRQIVDRVEHLLAKAEAYPNLRWLWAVGDSDDDTAGVLVGLATGYDVSIRVADSEISGEDGASRLRRLSYTGNALFSNLRTGDDYLLIHESDIASPYDVVNRLVERAEGGRCPIAAWPTIRLNGRDSQMYDIWAYRKDGVRFSAHPPYHADYQADKPFTVDSFGTVWMMAAEDAPHIYMTNGAVLDACAQLRARGRTLWCDPQIVVEQPVGLWAWHNVELTA